MDARLKAGFLVKILIPLTAVFLLGALFNAHTSFASLRNALFSNEPAFTTETSSTLLMSIETPTSDGQELERSGSAALSAGNPTEAVTLLVEASGLIHLSDAGWLALGDAYLEMGDTVKALSAWKNLPPSPALYPRLAEAYHQLEDFEGLLSTLRELLALHPGDASLYYYSGLVYAALRPDSSQAFLEQAASLDPQYKENSGKLIRTIRSARLQDEPAYTLVASGRALASMNQWILALEAFRRALSIRDDYAEAWAYYGEALQQVNIPKPSGIDQDPAMAALQKAVDLDPGSLAAHIFLSIYWQRQGHYVEAIAILETAAGLEPDNPVIYTEIGNSWAKAGDLIKSQTYYQQAVDMAPEDPFYWRLLAEFSLNNQVQIREIGLPAARKAVILEPKAPENLNLFGQALYFLGDHTNAAKYMKKALEIDPGYAPAYLNLGMNYLAQGETGQARDFLNQAVVFGGESPTAEHARRLLERHFP
jgi:tetratricopeptide (TPR) repeat protein